MSSAQAEVAALTAERDELNHAREAQAGELQQLGAALDEERERREQAEGEAKELRTQVADDEAADGATHPELDGSWALLLADVTRRWAAVVGAPPELRRVHLGAVPDQLTEALTREIDRLREEVGVDISFQAGTPVEPSDPIVFLLAAAHLLGELAASCQRVTVELDGRLVLAGDEWIGPVEDLEVARERAQAAGAVIDPVTVEEINPETLVDAESEAMRALDELSELDDPGPGKPGTPMFNVRLALHPTA